jgi:hypothetical protein
MGTFKFKLWRTVGVAAALSLAACGGEGGENGEGGAADAAAHGEAGEGEGGEGGAAPAAASAGGEAGEAGAASAYAGLSGDQLTALRLQHLKGFVLVAQRVAHGGAGEEATILVAQALLEVYDPAAAQFGALDVAPVRAAGEPGGNESARLSAAIAALDAARAPLNADYAGVAASMADISAGLYQGVVQPDFVDPIEYQHSLGAALAARDALVAGEATLRAQNGAAYTAALAELDRLIRLWPQTTAGETPSSYREVLAATSRVRLALSPFL